jgi:hypothetical protein
MYQALYIAKNTKKSEIALCQKNSVELIVNITRGSQEHV